MKVINLQIYYIVNLNNDKVFLNIFNDNNYKIDFEIILNCLFWFNKNYKIYKQIVYYKEHIE